MRNRTPFFVILVVFLGCGLFTANRLPPLLPINSASAVGPASGAVSNVIGAVGQQVSLFVPAGGAVRLNVSGTFTGTLSFKLSQDGGSTYSAVSLLNTATGSATDQSTTATGSWLYCPTSTNSGTLQVSATAWTSGTATVDMVDIAANPINIDLQLLASAARTAQVNTGDFQNPCWRGLKVYVDCTAASGTGGLQPTIQVKDPVSGKYVSEVLTGTNITATGTKVYIYYPTAGANPTLPLPFTWRYVTQVGDSTSYTYSVGATYLK